MKDEAKGRDRARGVEHKSQQAPFIIPNQIVVNANHMKSFYVKCD